MTLIIKFNKLSIILIYFLGNGPFWPHDSVLSMKLYHLKTHKRKHLNDITVRRWTKLQPVFSL